VLQPAHTLPRDARTGATPAAAAIPSIEPLRRLVATEMAAVNTAILDRMQSNVQLIPQLASHLIASGGKRIRPMLTLGAAKLCGYQGDRQILLAACVEFIHTATLLHDDVVDESERRRGAETANVVWGNQASVLVGDFLFSRAFQLMVESGSLEVLRILAGASAVIAEGEVLQLMTANDTATSEADYLKVIESKTAALFAAACRVGAVVADRPLAEAEALDTYGRDLGIAFQLIDDALDYASDAATLGKNTGDDFREGKVTLPIVLAFAAGDAAEKAFWKRVIEQPARQAPEDFDHALALLRRHGALGATLARAEAYGASAKAALDLFPDSPTRAALLEAVDFAIHRAA